MPAGFTYGIIQPPLTLLAKKGYTQISGPTTVIENILAMLSVHIFFSMSNFEDPACSMYSPILVKELCVPVSS